MTATRDPERLIGAFLDEGRTELPDRSYEAVRAKIQGTRQRTVVVRLLTPWPRSPSMIGIAATVMVTFVAVGAAVVGGGAPIGLATPPAQVVGANQSQVGQAWPVDTDVALIIHRDPADQSVEYWRAAAYDGLDLRGFSVAPTATRSVPAGSRVLAGMADDVDSIGRRNVSFTVDPGTFRGSSMVSPATPISVDVATRITSVGRDGYFAGMDLIGASPGPYTVTALVDQAGYAPGHWNVTALRAAGTDYPAEIIDLYRHVVTGTIGPSARALENKIIADAGPDATPIDKVESIMAELGSNAFTYNTDIRNLPCETLSTVECFARFRQGFCQYYAATMAVLLRDMGVPTRVVEGFLPGERSGNIEVIRGSSASSWVEVYFPRYGWVPFDPTGPSNPAQLPAPLPTGG
jgi:transglutaminase-like putative cysteine protease